MIVISLVLVIVAAVALVLGVLGDGLQLVYVSIGACLAAMVLLGIGVLTRRPGQATADAPGPPRPLGESQANRPRRQGARPRRRAADVRSGADEESTPHEPSATTRTPPLTEERGFSDEQETWGRPSGPEADDVGAPARRTGAEPDETRPGSAIPRVPAKKAVVKKTAVGAPGAGQRSDVSRLSAVAGLGPVKAKALLDHFGSVDAVRDADIDVLSSVDGMDRWLARRVKEGLEG